MSLLISFLSLFLLSTSPSNEIIKQTDTIDKFWAEIKLTVQEGDFEGHAALFAPNAVFVDGNSEATHTIEYALEELWKPGLDDTKSGKRNADIDLRFSKRLHNKSTAFEEGIFKYTYQENGEEVKHIYVPFQFLLTKTESGWKILMEHQKSLVEKKEWDDLASKK